MPSAGCDPCPRLPIGHGLALTLVSPRQCHIMMVTPQVETEHEVRTQEGVLPQVLRCDYISPLVLPSPCDTQKNQPCEQNIMKMWALGCTEHYTKRTILHTHSPPSTPSATPPLHVSTPGLWQTGPTLPCPSSPGQDTETLHSGSRNAVFMHLRYFHI